LYAHMNNKTIKKKEWEQRADDMNVDRKSTKSCRYCR
jgi:hypothetical protein